MKRLCVVVSAVLLSLALMGAERRTANFLVKAPTQEIADTVAKAAEQQRKAQALVWLGKELPAWKEPCTLNIEVNMNGPTGATTFAFAPKGGVLSQHMHLSGSLDRLLAAALPHEVTHTIFAHFLGRPVPRWADEGGAITAEDQQERERNTKIFSKAFHKATQMPLRRLFQLHDYPADLNKIVIFYGQSYSVSHYLIEKDGRTKFLDFMKRGYDDGWDEAAQAVYGHRNVEALEQAWLVWVRKR